MRVWLVFALLLTAKDSPSSASFCLRPASQGVTMAYRKGSGVSAKARPPCCNVLRFRDSNSGPVWHRKDTDSDRGTESLRVRTRYHVRSACRQHHTRIEHDKQQDKAQHSLCCLALSHVLLQFENFRPSLLQAVTFPACRGSAFITAEPGPRVDFRVPRGDPEPTTTKPCQ